LQAKLVIFKGAGKKSADRVLWVNSGMRLSGGLAAIQAYGGMEQRWNPGCRLACAMVIADTPEGSDIFWFLLV
jgi:hypothetical protein